MSANSKKDALDKAKEKIHHYFTVYVLMKIYGN